MIREMAIKLTDDPREPVNAAKNGSLWKEKVDFKFSTTN
jgi:hypothetical protein